MIISNSLLQIFGFNWAKYNIRFSEDADRKSDVIFDLNSGMRLMYVYCDVAAHTCVGDTQAPVLRVCNTEGEYGDTVRKSFVDTHYVPVQKRHFDTIEISINTEDGKSMPFQFGKSLVKLHFRRAFNYLSI